MNFSQRAVKSSLLLAGKEGCEASGEESSQSCLHTLVPEGCGSLRGIGTRCWWALGSEHCSCTSLVFLVETSGHGLRFTPGSGAAGVAVSRCHRSAQPPRCRFLCLHFEANCDALYTLCSSHFRVLDACPCKCRANPLGTLTNFCRVPSPSLACVFALYELSG